jgi:hypothetical protein
MENPKMPNETVFQKIKRAIEKAPRNGYVAELHLQVIKHADVLEGMSGKEFCSKLDVGPAWGTEFTKMKKIAPRLIEAGLKVELI